MNFFRNSTKDHIRYGHKTNVFSPLIWFCSVTVPPLLIAAWKFNHPIFSYILIFIVGFIVLFSLIMYAIILFKDSKSLHSESFRLANREQDRLDMFAAKGHPIMFDIKGITPEEEKQSIDVQSRVQA